MASQPLRAIYKDGQLRLLDPVNLAENQEIQLVILDDRERLRAALGDLVVDYPDSGEEFDEEALMNEVADALHGQTPLSQTIMDERSEGP